VTSRQIKAAHRPTLIGLEQAYAVRHPTLAGAFTLSTLATVSKPLPWHTPQRLRGEPSACWSHPEG